MKRCSYCGEENADDAAKCGACGETEFRSGDFSPNSASVPETEEADWVTLVRCRKLVEADLIATRLRAAGIPVFIPDEFLVQAVSFNLNTYGFVRVQVPPARVAEAREFLEGPTPADEE